MKSRDAKSQARADLEQFSAVESLFSREQFDLIEKIESIGKYQSRQSIAKFLTKYEIFKRILHVNGSIVECGVLHGAGLLTWAKLSSILEPANHTRKVIGFDTFEGFPSVHNKDAGTGVSEHARVGGLIGSSLENIREAVRVYDLNRPINHIAKVELVAGDILETADTYLANNPHLVVALLYLDLDLYEPTKKALEVFVPRMPKGGIIGFDQLNASIFPGETRAVDEVLGLANISIRRFPFDSYVSYATIQ
ncbi:MAG: TylF/MycF/NovP-related O-methyltransferase [Thermodesulfobacteriota bacterium]